MIDERRARLSRRFRGQGDACAHLGSPLYADLLDRAADDLDRAGPVWRVVEPLADLPGGALASLRWLGATHRLALSGKAAGLAAHYPSCGGDGDREGAWTALLALSETHAATGELRGPMLASGVQTNEVGRSAALLGGFLAVARSTGLPLRVLELGASAGLNLAWDRFAYHCDAARWGPPGAVVDHGDPWVEGGPVLEPEWSADLVAERRGCDLHPLDATSPPGRLTLLSFVWPDMTRRFELLDAACAEVAVRPVRVEEGSADRWLTDETAAPRAGVATVVCHSVFMMYLPAEARDTVVATIARAGATATAAAPLAWLRLEPAGALGPDHFEIRLTTWPGGDDRRLGTAHPHATWIRWSG